jgi:putative CocE/NonD family hydrolase
MQISKVVLRTALGCGVAVALCGVMRAQSVVAAFDVKAHYAKSEYHVRMRDGVELFTVVYAPRDTSKSYPFLVNRTPYSVQPYGAEAYRPALGPARAFEEAGYIFVYQDVRGRYQSGGVYVKPTPHIDKAVGLQHDESTDMYDTVEWLLKHVPHNNGRVGIYGISADGFMTTASIIDGHPAIKAASPQCPVTDYHDNDDYYHNGALMLETNSFYNFFRPQQTPVMPEKPKPLELSSADAYAGMLKDWEPLYKARAMLANLYFDDVVDHPEYDALWVSRDISRHLHGIHAAVLVVGGWFDAEDLSGPFKTYNAIAAQSPEAKEYLVVGPWVHGGFMLPGERVGDVRFGSKTGDYFRGEIEFPFFEHYLKDAPDPKLAAATVFETGTNAWKTYTAWPPKSSKERTLYLQLGGGLSFEAPKASEARDYDEYVSDPWHPVPEVGYAHLPGPPRDYMDDDQRFAEGRPDVLVYQTEPLTEDVTMAGPLQAKLHVATSGTDSDFDVKLIDVYPQDFKYGDEAPQARVPGAPLNDVMAPPVLMGGYEQLVRGEPARGKYRKGLDAPVPFVPNQPEEMDVSLVEVNHTFLKGHRIMVQIQSTWFPLTDLNPQTFVSIPSATEQDFKVATERVYHSAVYPSVIVFASPR